MKKTEPGKILQADPELDTELDRMAEDVPPMPADFHEKWMNAIRAEAGQAVPAPEEESAGKTGSIMRWTRVLSIAAVFVFLIGGTILYRNSGETLSGTFRKDQAASVSLSAEAPAQDGPAGTENETVYAEADEAAEMPGEAAAPMAGSADVIAEPALFGAAAKKADNTETAGSTAANGLADDFLYEAEAYEEAAAEESVMVAGEYTAAEAEIRQAEPAPVPVATGMPTEAPAGPEAAAPGEAAEEKAAEESQQEEGLLSRAGEFLKDMGRFLLAALPYLAVLAVPAAIALAVRRRKKK